jgi:hypothetical protein
MIPTRRAQRRVRSWPKTNQRGLSSASFQRSVLELSAMGKPTAVPLPDEQQPLQRSGAPDKYREVGAVQTPF